MSDVLVGKILMQPEQIAFIKLYKIKIMDLVIVFW